jgi:hypothetical protein
MLEADYLLHLDRDAMNAAARAGNPCIESFCNACFSGEYPTGDITPDVLAKIEGERRTSQKVFTFENGNVRPTPAAPKKGEPTPEGTAAIS